VQAIICRFLIYGRETGEFRLDVVVVWVYIVWWSEPNALNWVSNRFGRIEEYTRSIEQYTRSWVVEGRIDSLAYRICSWPGCRFDPTTSRKCSSRHPEKM